LVIIEHELDEVFDEAWRDFWKACLYIAPLRIMIGYVGYREDGKDAEERGNTLRDWYRNWKLHQSHGSETLLLIGWWKRQPQDISTCHWHYWLKSAGGDWEDHDLTTKSRDPDIA
jgi:hypothetical protein